MKKKIIKYNLLILYIVVLIVILNACNINDKYIYKLPEKTGDGWEIASLRDVGIDAQYLEDLMNKLNNSENHLLHSLVIIKNGKLVFEEYFSGMSHPILGNYPIDYDRDTMHVLSSTTKSYTSALLGIAIKQGFIRDVNQKVFDFFPELALLNTGEKKDMTIKHMITMSSGLEWDQTTYPILDPKNDIAKIQRAANPWEFYLSRPIITNPGEVFLYSEACINIVGEIIRRASGMRLDHFSKKYLFDPLGIDQFYWNLVKPNINWIWASGDLRQRPRDMAKFGQLYLQKGKWNGKQIVPEEWVKLSSKSFFSFSPPFWSVNVGLVGYSYAWWLKSSDYGLGAYSTSGWGDQYIIVLPEFEMVVVFTGGSYYDKPLLESHEIMIKYILPALL